MSARGTWIAVAALAGTTSALLLVALALLHPPAEDGGAEGPRAAAASEVLLAATPSPVGPIEAARLAAPPPGREAPAPLPLRPTEDPGEQRLLPGEPPDIEATHYAAFVRLGREQGLDALQAAATEALDDARGRDHVRVAALRALVDAGAPRAVELLGRAAGQAATTPRPGRVGVAEFAARCLAARAPDDAAARATLLVLVDGAADAALRRRAATALARWADADELLLLAARVRHAADPLLAASVREGLSHRADAAGSAASFLPEPVSPLPSTSDD